MAIRLPAIPLPVKPLYGSPYNGCGLCCALELCVVAEMVFPNATPPCPALNTTQDGSRTYCGLVAVEKMHGLPPIIEKALGIGIGCSMRDDFSSEYHDDNSGTNQESKDTSEEG